MLLAAAAALTLADVDVIDTQPALDAYVGRARRRRIGALHAAGADAVSLLGADHPELVPVLEAALDAADPTGAAAAVTAGILPALRRQLKSTALRGALAGLLGTSDAVVTALTSGPDVLHGHADATVGALADLLALGTAVALDARRHPRRRRRPARDGGPPLVRRRAAGHDGRRCGSRAAR